jgi:hypothetical protein
MPFPLLTIGEMDPNPYETPKSPSFADTPKRSGEGDPTQILAEIRDIQRELLDMTRQAVVRQRRMVRFVLALLGSFRCSQLPPRRR